MDVSKFKPSDWLKTGGGVVMLIAYFLPWWEIDFAGLGSEGSVSGSEYFFTGTLPWLLLVAVGALAFLSAAGVFKLPPTIPAPLVFLAASAFSLLLVIFRFFSDGFDTGGFGEVPTARGIGLFLALAAAVVVVVGSVLGFKESGGNLNDLKDVNKLKSSFGGGGAGAPPPPPGGITPPPPPPPPPGGNAPPPPPPPGG